MWCTNATVIINSHTNSLTATASVHTYSLTQIVAAAASEAKQCRKKVYSSLDLECYSVWVRFRVRFILDVIIRRHFDSRSLECCQNARKGVFELVGKVLKAGQTFELKFMKKSKMLNSDCFWHHPSLVRIPPSAILIFLNNTYLIALYDETKQNFMSWPI